MKKLILLLLSTSLYPSTEPLPLTRSYRVDGDEVRLVAALAASPARAYTELEESCWHGIGRYVIAQGGAQRLLPAENKNCALLEKWALAARMHDACTKDADWCALSEKYTPFFTMVAKHAASKHRDDAWWGAVDSDRLIRRWFAVTTALKQVVSIPFAWTSEAQRGAVPAEGGIRLLIEERPASRAIVTMESSYYAAALSLRSVEKRSAPTTGNCVRTFCTAYTKRTLVCLKHS